MTRVRLKIPWIERAVVRVDISPMNPKVKIALLSCGHDAYRNRRPRIGAMVVCEKCSRAENSDSREGEA